MGAIIKTGVRILTPQEYFAIESQITKPSLKSWYEYFSSQG
jgi:hypothetical protein